MTSSRLSIALAALLVSGLAVPTVQAYITPQEMLTGTANHTSAVDPEEGYEEKDWEIIGEEPEEDLPSGLRYSNSQTEYREQPSKNDHTVLVKYRSSSSIGYAAAPEEEVIEEPELEEEDDTAVIELDARTLRLLERLTRTPSQHVISPAAHEGAPLTPTGPATLIAMGTMLGAGIWTIRRARKSGKAFIR